LSHLNEERLTNKEKLEDQAALIRSLKATNREQKVKITNLKDENSELESKIKNLEDTIKEQSAKIEKYNKLKNSIAKNLEAF
jgi:hypothetical protein